MADVAFLAVVSRRAFRAEASVGSQGAMVREVTLAITACFAGLAASVEGRLEVLPCLREGGERFVFCAGGAAVRPDLGRAVVAQSVALSVLPQVAELEGSAAPAASFELVLLCLVASLADVRVRREVPLRALQCAFGAL